LAVTGAVRLTDRLGVALAAEPDGSFAAVPIAREEYGGPWRRARPGDGLSAFLAGVPEASERPIGVDQTHESIVVGERAILKWFRHVGPGPSRASLLLAHLANVGFDGIPTPLGSLGWRLPGSRLLTLAQGDAYLPRARDGWEWVLERCETGDATVGEELGRLVAALHHALAAFRRNRINLTKIESRPSKRRAWEYFFFIDCDGHQEDRKVAKAIEQLGQECSFVKVLGSYPNTE